MPPVPAHVGEVPGLPTSEPSTRLLVGLCTGAREARLLVQVCLIFDPPLLM